MTSGVHSDRPTNRKSEINTLSDFVFVILWSSIICDMLVYIYDSYVFQDYGLDGYQWYVGAGSMSEAGCAGHVITTLCVGGNFHTCMQVWIYILCVLCLYRDPRGRARSPTPRCPAYAYMSVVLQYPMIINLCVTHVYTATHAYLPSQEYYHNCSLLDMIYSICSHIPHSVDGVNYKKINVFVWLQKKLYKCLLCVNREGCYYALIMCVSLVTCYSPTLCYMTIISLLTQYSGDNMGIALSQGCLINYFYNICIRHRIYDMYMYVSAQRRQCIYTLLIDILSDIGKRSGVKPTMTHVLIYYILIFLSILLQNDIYDPAGDLKVALHTYGENVSTVHETVLRKYTMHTCKEQRNALENKHFSSWTCRSNANNADNMASPGIWSMHTVLRMSTIDYDNVYRIFLCHNQCRGDFCLMMFFHQCCLYIFAMCVIGYRSRAGLHTCFKYTYLQYEKRKP